MDAKPTPAHWPDVRLLLQGLRARRGPQRPARDPRAVRSRGGGT
jgi:hypothetical protein